MRFSMKKKLRESAIRARRRRLRESKEQVLNQYQGQVRDLIFDQYKELERYGLEVGLDGKYSDTSPAKFAKDIRKEWIKAATEEKEDDEEFATNPAIDPTKAVDEAIRGLNREMRWNDLKDLYEFAKEVDEREKRKKMKESRFRFRRGRIAEGTEISMAKARELSANSFTDTSEEVIWAIFKIAKDEEDAQRIWEDPSPSEQKRVLKIAFDAADEDTLYWGDQEFDRDEYISESRFRRGHLRESIERFKEEVFEDMVDDIVDELKYITPERLFDIAVDDERAHKGKKELLDSILSFMGSSVAARYEDEHYVSDVDGIEAANEAADRIGRKSLENDFWEAFQEEKKDISESRFRKSRNMLKESRELRRMKLLAGMFKRA